MSNEQLLNDLKTLCEKASEAILEVYHSEDFEVEKKKDSSPVTIADKRSDAILNEGLNRLTPDIPVMSEESIQLPYEERKKWKKFWCVDPLDGTREFVKKNDQFAICIALVEDGRPILGMIYEVVPGDCYYASKSNGAYLEKKDGTKKKLECSSFDWGEENLTILCSLSHRNNETEEFIDNFPNHHRTRLGAALKFCMIARGEAQLYPRLGPTCEWDTAAGDILLHEAGGQIVRFEDKKPLIYNKENILSPHFVAMGKLNGGLNW